MSAVINLRLLHPYWWWESTKLIGIRNPEARTAVRTIFSKALMEWLNEHPDEARIIIERAKSNQKPD